MSKKIFKVIYIKQGMKSIGSNGRFMFSEALRCNVEEHLDWFMTEIKNLIFLYQLLPFINYKLILYQPVLDQALTIISV